MLGKLYQSDPSNLETVNHKIYSDFRNLIWLTYRCGFKELLPNIKSEYISDTGWGCMIRVGQMLLAEILKTHTRASNCQEIKHIAYHFKDCKEAALSIHRVANEGHRYFGIDPGKWYNPSQIAYVLSDILEKCKLEEAKDLVLKVFNNCNLFFDELLDAMAPKRNQCLQPGHAGHDGQLQKRVICTRCNVVDKSVAIVILVRMGYDKV